MPDREEEIRIKVFWIIPHLPTYQLCKQADQSHLQVGAGVGVDPVVGLDDKVAFPMPLKQTLLLPGRNVQG